MARLLWNSLAPGALVASAAASILGQKLNTRGPQEDLVTSCASTPSRSESFDTCWRARAFGEVATGTVLAATLAAFDITGEVRAGRVGVWVDTSDGGEAKIAALGIRVRRWVTFHGISLNVAPDLTHYDGIVACGIKEHGVTSLQALGVDVSMDEVDAVLKQEFAKRFGG